MLTWSVNLNPNRLCPDLSPSGLAAATPAAFERLTALGANGVRLDLFWGDLLPSPGAPNLALLGWYRDFLDEAARRGVQVYALLYHPPAWAQAALARGPAGHADFLAGWREVCALVGEHLAHRLSLLQLWNEPNNFLAALKGDPVLFHTRRLGPVALPVGVPYETLAALFAIAREVLGPGLPLVYNVLTNLSPFLPFRGGWLDWEHFTDRFLALAHEHVDVIALDHYPDTWAPGTGPLEWQCVEVAAARIADPASAWHGKSLIMGEVGYSSAPNFHLLPGPLKLGRFFPEDRDEVTMARWYAAALSHLAERLAPGKLPHNRHHWINVYELYDPPRILGGHPVLAIEDHFGLIRRDGTPKPAFHAMRDVVQGLRLPDLASHAPTRTPLYWRLAQWGRKLTPTGPPLVLERRVPRAEVPSPEAVKTTS